MKKNSAKAGKLLIVIEEVLKKNKFRKEVDAEIYGYKTILNEYQVRALQVILHNTTDEHFKELTENIIIYSGPKNHEQMIFNRDGTFKNEFERGFYDISPNLALQIFK